MGNIGWAQLLIVLVIVLLLFGTKKLRSLGGDLGSAVKGFKKAVSDKDAEFEEESKKVEDKTEQTAQKSESVKQSEKTE
ncbi:MAG: Sec-independent protein translocase subunit TatA [Aliiglaciecola sp.]|uniref:twin-arginine translocase TatA/TatE family subunit n=1 Tax=Aliiglaciecola sp. M165 TaxID=2593649 RepID=UPI00117C5202|nr:twin-arginine translocase TatA/TatE family subunit [Aliiglaciecola sp. M165]TRY33044.1 twin-arginine translocase TatA/TatE family subunit [Aliiglaciecola sp. M165]